MDSIQVTERAVTIRLSGGEVPGGRTVAALVRRALAARGMTPWAETAVECFSSGRETLIIAHPGPARRRAFFFEGIDQLRAGALCCPDGDSDLYAAEDGRGYILAVAPEMARPGLYEFGVPADFSPDRETHAREQGLCLSDGQAVADLRRRFATERL